MRLPIFFSSCIFAPRKANIIEIRIVLKEIHLKIQIDLFSKTFSRFFKIWYQSEIQGHCTYILNHLPTQEDKKELVAAQMAIVESGFWRAAPVVNSTCHWVRGKGFVWGLVYFRSYMGLRKFRLRRAKHQYQWCIHQYHWRICVLLYLCSDLLWSRLCT